MHNKVPFGTIELVITAFIKSLREELKNPLDRFLPILILTDPGEFSPYRY